MATHGSGSQPGPSNDTPRSVLSRIPPDTPLEEVFRRACELSAHALGVERVGVWLFIDARTILRCANLFERSRGEHSSGTLLRVADFPTYFSSLKIFKAVPAEIATSDPWTAELADSYLHPLGISSMLDVGLFVDDNLAGVICHEHVGAPREWTAEDRSSAMGAADALASRIQAAKTKELRATFSSHLNRPESAETSAALLQLSGVVRDFQSLLAVQLRQLGRQEKGPRVIDLDTETARLVPLLQASLGPRYELRYRHAGRRGRVLIDRAQYQELVSHLVTSASEAMPGGGRIDVSLSAARPRDDSSPSNLCVQLDVSDDGPQADEATGARVRLLMARQIVDVAGGSMLVTGAPDRGTTVRVLLPRISASGTA